MLRDPNNSSEALEDIGLPLGVREDLLAIVNRIEYLRPKPIQNGEDGKDTEANKMRKMLLESFVHIRWSFWISLIMSVVLFIVGLIFMGSAVMQSLSEGSASTATLTIAGLGIADFVLLFYTRPWQDISVNLSNSQQVKIIATSYLAGLALLPEGKTEEAFHLLEKITKNSVHLLERKFPEERSSESTKTGKMTYVRSQHDKAKEAIREVKDNASGE